MLIKVSSGILAEVGVTGKGKGALATALFGFTTEARSPRRKKLTSAITRIYSLRPFAPLPLKKAWIPAFAGASVSAEIGRLLRFARNDMIGGQIRRSRAGGGRRAMEADAGRFLSISFAFSRSWHAYKGNKVRHDEAHTKGLIESTGYHRRDREVRLLEQVLAARS